MATETELEPQQSPMAEEQQPSPFSLPPYPQMIMEAIEASNDANGCNKTAIAKHIESTQTSLPPSHMTLLSYHLNQMKQSGQIAMVKNNYMKPDPQAPPKRGRGRPPKAKPQGESSHVAVPAPSVSSPRPRGRPPKAKGPSSEVETKVAAPSGSGRPRGRPPKKQKTESEAVKADVEPAEAPAGERRGRGRPPKAKPAMVPVGC
uniref:HMG-Y-related protein A n=1 Tax=Brassica napus TaxID=3708 RepID=Q9SEH2_BRANA|nr:HMG-Y-related protein A-like [Brassica napus]AAF22135.1 high mobility group protein I/Y [Brassica napus]